MIWGTWRASCAQWGKRSRPASMRPARRPFGTSVKQRACKDALPPAAPSGHYLHLPDHRRVQRAVIGIRAGRLEGEAERAGCPLVIGLEQVRPGVELAVGRACLAAGDSMVRVGHVDPGDGGAYLDRDAGMVVPEAGQVGAGVDDLD